MSLVEIVEVTKTELDAEQLRGRNIEVPKTGDRSDSDTIHVAGWVLGQSSPAVIVEILHGGTVLQSAPIDVQRPDIISAFPDVPGAEQSGFRTMVTVPDIDEGELLVAAVLRDDSWVQLGAILVRRSQSDEEQYAESSVRDQPGPVTGFFRRLLGRGGD